jgi:hypothetical protein
MDHSTQEPDTLLEQAEQYAKTNAELYTLMATEKMALIISSILSRLVILIFVFIIFLILAMGLSYWVGEKMGHTHSGFLVVAGGAFVLTLLLYVFRNAFLQKPVMNALISEVLKKD